MAKKRKNTSNSNKVEEVLENIIEQEKEKEMLAVASLEENPVISIEEDIEEDVTEEESDIEVVDEEPVVTTSIEDAINKEGVSLISEEEIPVTITEKEVDEEPVKKEVKSIGNLQRIPGKDHLISNTVSEPKPVNNATGTQQVVSTPETKKKRNYRLGAPIDLENEPIYSGPYATVPKKKLTGRYYIYDGIEKNGFYRITDTKAHVNKDLKWIVGYVKK